MNVDEGGQVIADPALDLYPSGTEVTLTARADPGYEFNNWSGNQLGVDTTVTLIMDGNKLVTASFTQLFYPFRFRAEPRGSASILVRPIAQQFVYNDTVVVIADPFDGWEFTHWSGTLESTNPIDTIIVVGPVDITGNFREKKEEPVDTVVTSLVEDASKLFPNPVTNKLNLSGVPQGSTIEVVDMAGARIAFETFQKQTIQLNTSKWPSGLYIVEVKHISIAQRYRVMKW